MTLLHSYMKECRFTILPPWCTLTIVIPYDMNCFSFLSSNRQQLHRPPVQLLSFRTKQPLKICSPSKERVPPEPGGILFFSPSQGGKQIVECLCHGGMCEDPVPQGGIGVLSPHGQLHQMTGQLFPLHQRLAGVDIGVTLQPLNVRRGGAAKALPPLPKPMITF